jgi:ABC-type Fe3+ transport system substrate-binding protein
MFFRPSKYHLVYAVVAGLSMSLLSGGGVDVHAQEKASVTGADVLMSNVPQRQEMLIEGAKAEGEVVIYSAAIVNQALKPLATAFMKKYPFIKTTYWRGDTSDIVSKVSAEMRASKLIADVVESTGAGDALVAAQLTVPFYSPELENYASEYRDPHHLWAATRLSYFSIAYNTKLVSEDDVPKTYEDLLDPKWKGKMGWRVGTESGMPLFISSMRLARGEEAAKDYLTRLAQQRIINFASGSARTLVDRVIAGEMPIALNIFAHHPLISRAKGAPVNSRLLEPVPSAAGTLVIPRGVRHPHAAMLLADFILSKEGQSIFAQAEYFPARGDVEPLPELAPVVPSHAHMKDNFVSPDMLQTYTESSTHFFEEIFLEK